jgi:hypothetical protein
MILDGHLASAPVNCRRHLPHGCGRVESKPSYPQPSFAKQSSGPEACATPKTTESLGSAALVYVPINQAMIDDFGKNTCNFDIHRGRGMA